MQQVATRMQHAGLSDRQPNDLRQAYEALLGESSPPRKPAPLTPHQELIKDVDRNLDELRLETDPKRPDILPGIPQAILPILRRIVDQSQAFRTGLRGSVKGKEMGKMGGSGGKGDDASKKRRRESATDPENAAATAAGRQAIRDKLDQEGAWGTAVGDGTDFLQGTNLWNRTLLIS